MLLIILTVALRFALMPIYLQAYLNIAYDRLEEQKKEAGRITNIDLQRKVFAATKVLVLFVFIMIFLISDYINILLFVRRHIAICGATYHVLIFCANV